MAQDVRTRTIYLASGLTGAGVLITPDPDTTLVITYIAFYQGVILVPGTVRLKNHDDGGPTIWFQGNADPAGTSGAVSGKWVCTYGEAGLNFISDGNAWDIYASGYVLFGTSPLGPYPFEN